jgi:hypothetical protein
MEGEVHFNNFNVNNSVIGVLNTGTIQSLSNIDAAFQIIKNEGNEELVKRLGEFTQAVIESKELVEISKEEISQQLEYLVGQLTVEKPKRTTGVIKAILSGIKGTVSSVASIITIWAYVEPLLHAQLIN